MPSSFQPVPTWWRQKRFQQFREAFRTQYAQHRQWSSSGMLLFVGSGLSLGARPPTGDPLPTWSGLLQKLAQIHGEQNPGATPTLAERVAEQLADLADDDRFYKAGSQVRSSFHRSVLRAEMERLLNAPSWRNAELPVHRHLIDSPWQRIITTNYDCLIEEAYRQVKAREVAVYHPLQKNLNEMESGGSRVVYKIHGDIAQRDSELVLADEDYQLLYHGRLLQEGNGAADKAAQHRCEAFKLSLSSLVRTSSLTLFIGYGHNDRHVKRVWDYARTGIEVENAFALVPIQGPLDSFEKKIAEREGEKIFSIGYCADDGHAELAAFVEYMANFDEKDAEYARRDARRRPTVVMVTCGGTIGAEQAEPDPTSPLRVKPQPTRYAAELREFRDRLAEWYGEFYNAGHDLEELEIEWEVLPLHHQIFSENATPEYWNGLARGLADVMDKYVYLPPEISGLGEAGAKARLMPPRLLQLFREDRRQLRLAQGHAPDAGTAEEAAELKRFIDHVSNRYLLGVVMLTGTDTLAYAASALSLGLQHLPCPVVLTGSSQPPTGSRLRVNERGRYFTRSDAWRNLMTSLFFLQSFGHLLTEVFVCYGETVHHGVNLRKVSTDAIPFTRDPGRRRGGEHFIFRNLSYRCQYMFRLVDGLWCNNYYPRDSISFATLVGAEREEFGDLRHVRPAPGAPVPRLEVMPFSEAVWHLKATPAFPRISVVALPPDDRPRAVLLEAYTSGTFPTAARSNLSALLRELQDLGIPVVVVARSGLRPTQVEYMTENADEEALRTGVLPLYGVVEETALPLLSYLAADLRRRPAGAARNGRRERRRSGDARERLFQAIRAYFNSRPNLVTEEFEGLLEREKSASRRNRLKAEARGTDATAMGWDPRFGIFQRVKEWIARGGPPPADPGDGPRDGSVALSREGFAALIDEILRPFRRVGAAPDGFSVLSGIGFEMGLSLFDFLAHADDQGTQQPIRFRDLGPEQKGCALARMDGLLQRVRAICATCGVAHVEVENVTTDPAPDRWGESEPEVSFGFRVRASHHDHGFEIGNERYTVVGYSQDDREFFSRLCDACTDAGSAERHLRNLEASYTLLLTNQWQHRLHAVDWLLVGFWKGAACGMARALRFDPLALEGRYPEPGHLRALREAVRCDVLAATQNTLYLDFTYFATRERRDRRPAPEPAPGLAPGDPLPVPIRVAGPEELAAAADDAGAPPGA